MKQHHLLLNPSSKYFDSLEVWSQFYSTSTRYRFSKITWKSVTYNIARHDLYTEFQTDSFPERSATELPHEPISFYSFLGCPNLPMLNVVQPLVITGDGCSHSMRPYTFVNPPIFSSMALRPQIFWNTSPTSTSFDIRNTPGILWW